MHDQTTSAPVLGDLTRALGIAQFRADTSTRGGFRITPFRQQEQAA